LSDIHGAKDASFGDFVKAVEEGAYSEPFVTGFLHEMKFLRNRAVDHQLALSACSAQIIDAVELGDVLGITQSLTQKTWGSQLKDKLALNTFRLANLVALAESGYTRGEVAAPGGRFQHYEANR
jgi:hypothetical protein